MSYDDQQRQDIEDRIVARVQRVIEEQGMGALVAGVQNDVEFHFHVDDVQVAEALARLLLMGAHDLSINLKARR